MRSRASVVTTTDRSVESLPAHLAAHDVFDRAALEGEPHHQGDPDLALSLGVSPSTKSSAVPAETSEGSAAAASTSRVAQRRAAK